MAGIRGVTGWIGVNLACTDPPSLATFYAELFGWEVSSSEPTHATVLVVGRATRGETMIITDRGRPIALLRPPPSEAARVTTDSDA